MSALFFENSDGKETCRILCSMSRSSGCSCAVDTGPWEQSMPPAEQPALPGVHEAPPVGKQAAQLAHGDSRATQSPGGSRPSFSGCYPRGSAPPPVAPECKRGTRVTPVCWMCPRRPESLGPPDESAHAAPGPVPAHSARVLTPEFFKFPSSPRLPHLDASFSQTLSA